jgi:hypothetical protein
MIETVDIMKMGTKLEIINVTRKQTTPHNIPSEMAPIHCNLKSSVAEIIGFTKAGGVSF